MSYLSYSQLQSWLDCRQKWAYSYWDNLEPKQTFPAMELGKEVHEAIATAMVQQARGEEINVEGKDEVAELALQAYKQFDWDEFSVYSHKGEPAVEMELFAELPIPDGFPTGMYWDGVRGFVDLILEDKNGGLWVVDHKTRRQFQASNAEQFNLQMAIYQYLAAANGMQTAGTILNEVKTGLKPGSRAEPFRMTRYYRSPVEIQAVWDEIVVPVAEEIAEYQMYGGRIIRNCSPRSCGSCGFRDLCFGQMRNDDVQFLVDVAYRPKEPNERGSTDVDQTERKGT